MLEFLRAAGDSGIIRNALLMTVLISVACGIVGTYVVTRRISSIAGGLSHCVLGGMGAAHYLKVVHGWTFLTPIHGALAAALTATALIGWVTLRGHEREDTIIGALWAIGMAAGILFLSQTPGYNEDLMGYLFGNITLVSGRDLWLVALLDMGVVGTGILFFKQFQAICFDEEFARLRGVRVDLFYLLLLALTAVTVVLLSTVVGIVMVIALLTLPVAIGNFMARSLGQLMVLSSVLCMLFTTGGLCLSYTPDLPPGATIIAITGLTYLLVLVGSRVLAKRTS